MDRPQNGFEFLEELKKRNGKQVQTYKSFYDYLDRKAREKGIPLHGQFELTPLCNFDCKMCYVHLNSDQMAERKTLSVEKWKTIIHQAFELGMMSATLTGGECLTYPGFDELYLYLHSLGCRVSVLSNGYLLDEERINFFKNHMPTGIGITLYGWNDDVYERVTGCRRVFDIVKNNISKAIEAGLPIRISITPNAYLGEDVFETIRVARDLTPRVNINSEIIIPREETGKSGLHDDPDIDAYIRIYKFINEIEGIETKEIDEDKLPPVGSSSHECNQCGLRCGGGRSCFVVDWKGTLMPCNRLDMIRALPLTEGFKSAWEKVNKEAKTWPRVPECEACAYREVCNICAAKMLEYAEPGKQPFELCKRTRLFVQHGVTNIPECEEL